MGIRPVVQAHTSLEKAVDFSRNTHKERWLYNLQDDAVEGI